MNNIKTNNQHGFLIKLNETNLMAMVSKHLNNIQKHYEDFSGKYIGTEVYCMGVEVKTISFKKAKAKEKLHIRFPVFIAKNKVVMHMIDMSLDLDIDHCKECNPTIQQSMIHIESLDELISTALHDNNQIAELLTDVAFEE